MPTERQLLIVEDDATLSRTLKRSFERRGYHVATADSQDSVLDVLKNGFEPTHAVVDLKLSGASSGLSCVQSIRSAVPTARIVVLTGFASIATAVEAIKLGADHYLAKPSNTDDIEAAFARTGGNPDTPLNHQQSSIKTLEWEHIHQMLVDTDFNISEAARRLGMHRRTLARKLEKRQIK